MVDCLLSDIGIVVVLPIRSSPLATGVLVLTCTGTGPVAKKSVMNPTCGVDCQKRFPVVQTNSMCQVASVCRTLAWNVDLE